MTFVAAICAVFIIAGFAGLGVMGTGNSAALETAAARANAGRKVCLGGAESRNFYMRQFDEAVASYK